jgi:uncharacterized membrane protein
MDKTTKLLGGWGYIAFIVLGIFGGFLGPVAFLSIVGAIIVVIAYVRAAGEYNRPEIRTNAIISLVLGIAAIVVFIVFIGASVVGLIFHHTTGGLAGFTGGMIAGGIITWILWILSTWFWYRASAALGEASGQSLFKTGGLLIFIGAITIIVFGLGGIVCLIGEILLTVGFFSTPDKVQAQQAGVAPSAFPPSPPPASPTVPPAV